MTAYFEVGGVYTRKFMEHLGLCATVLEVDTQHSGYSRCRVLTSYGTVEDWNMFIIDWRRIM